MNGDVRQCQRKAFAAAHASRDVAIADYANNRLAKASNKVIRLVAN